LGFGFGFGSLVLDVTSNRYDAGFGFRGLEFGCGFGFGFGFGFWGLVLDVASNS
jgi:hypothetical protein